MKTLQYIVLRVAFLFSAMGLAFATSHAHAAATNINFFDASGNNVTVKDASGFRLPVAATFSPTGTQDTNLIKVDGVPASVGSGVTNSGTLRVVLPTDQPAISVTSLSSAPVTPGAATATKSNLIGCQYDTTPATFTNGQQGHIACGASGALAVSSAVANGVAPVHSPLLTAGWDGTLTRTFLTDTGGREVVVGASAAGSAPVGSPVLVGGSDGTNVRTLPLITQADAQANANALLVTGRNEISNGTTWDQQRSIQGVNGVGLGVTAVGDYRLKASSYAAAVNISIAASASDILVIAGSASKTVWIQKIRVSGIQTSAGLALFLLNKHSTNDTGGTSVLLNNVPLSSTNGGATATVRAYTANPTIGTNLGAIRADYIEVNTVGGSVPETMEWSFGINGQPLVLNGTAQEVAVNLNGVTLAGGQIAVSVEWIEF